MRNIRFVLPFLLLWTAIAFHPFIHATTLARLSLDQLASGSDGVARVRIVSAESRWDKGSIWTLATAKIVETMKGDLPPQIVIRVPGGRVGHLLSTVEGTPKFHPGDDVVVFLQRSRLGDFSVAGWVEGTFRISPDPQSGGETVTQDSSAFTVFDAATRTFRSEGIRHMPIAEFRGRLAAAFARSEEKSR